MLTFKKITIKEFKKDVYHDFCTLFSKEERKPYYVLKRNFKDHILQIYKIEHEGIYIGFMLFNRIAESRLLQFDYFGILPKYQNKGYGKETIRQLKIEMKDYDCIYGEVEKEGYGRDKKENEIRKRRMNFYKELGFYPLEYDLNLFDVIYTPICLPLFEKQSDEKILADAFQIYASVLGKRMLKHCKLDK